MFEHFLDLWGGLEKDAGDGADASPVYRRVEPDADIDFFLEVTPPGKSRAVRIETAGSLDQIRRDLPDCGGLNVSLTSIKEEREDRLVLRIRLENPVISDIFGALACDLVRHLRASESSAASIDRASVRLRHWQKMLEFLGSDGLSQTAQRGLFGELWVLRNFIATSVPVADAIASWYGPSASPQDFLVGSKAVEVKTTTTKRHDMLQIASEKQLDDTPYDALYLAHIRIDLIDAGGSSLLELVTGIRELLHDDPGGLEDFAERLAWAGYLEVHKEKYGKCRYHVHAVNIYNVAKGFPRLVESDIPPGVGEVRYSIVTGDCARFSIEEDEFRNGIRGAE